jgi:hypothetical protein
MIVTCVGAAVVVALVLIGTVVRSPLAIPDPEPLFRGV